MATTFPLATLAAQVTEAGISAPSYSDILSSLKAIAQQIYGPDIYVEADSQDGQLLSIFAQAINDCNNTAIAVYNAYSPSTAIGAGLSSVVKINGLKRQTSSNSQVDLTLVGVAGTQIFNGVIQDENGNKWDLQPLVTIPGGGSITATAICETPGAIAASANTVTQIITPTLGWQMATNPAAATEGAPVETDAELRIRQSVSTEIAAQAIIGGIRAAVANVPGVQQSKIFENDTGSTDANTVPAHSIAVVVEGGDDTAIAQAIEQKKPPGTGTYGTTSETVLDPVGLPVLIHFYRPTSVTIDVTINLTALVGYTSSTGLLIEQAVQNYINTLGINGNQGLVSLSALYGVIYSVPNSNTFNITSVEISRDPAAVAAEDVTIAFNEVPVTTFGNIVLNVTS